MKEIFTCSYCGKEYDTPIERARCEISCDKRIKEQEERAELERLRGERKDREEKIQEAFDKYLDLAKAFNNDYKMPAGVVLKDTYTTRVDDFIFELLKAW